MKIETIRDLKARGQASHGLAGEKLRYLITNIPQAYLFVSDTRKGPIPDIYYTSQEAFNAMAGDRLPLEEALKSELFLSLVENGKDISREEADEMLDDLRKDDENKTEDENSVQTGREAELHSHEKLITQIRQMYDPDMPKLPTDLSGFVQMKGPAERPAVIITYGFPSPVSFMPTETYLYFPSALVVSSLKGGEYKEYRSFMYENLKKSSKISFGLGLNLLEPPKSPGQEKPVTPEEGEPVHDNGEPKSQPGGSGIVSFDFSWIKTWCRLTIKAEVRRSFSFDGYDRKVFQIPSA